MKQTLQEQLVRGLLALGYKEEKCASRGFRAFVRYGDGDMTFSEQNKMFVGKAGALRTGPRVSRSTPAYSQRNTVMKAGAL